MGKISGYLIKNSDNSIEFRGAQDAATGEIITDATMRVSLFTQQDVPVAGMAWPIAGTYIVDSAGDYVAVIQDTIDWTADTVYKAVVVLDGGFKRKRTMVRYLELIE